MIGTCRYCGTEVEGFDFCYDCAKSCSKCFGMASREWKTMEGGYVCAFCMPQAKKDGVLTPLTFTVVGFYNMEGDEPSDLLPIS